MTTYGVDRSSAAGGNGSAVTPIEAAVVTAKGDLIVGSASGQVDNLTVGTNRYTLQADSAETLGIKWVDGNEAIKNMVLSGTAITSLATGDSLLIYDVSETTGHSMTVTNVFRVINSFTEDTAPDVANDFLLTYDASALAGTGLPAKVTLTTAFASLNNLTEDTVPDPAADYVVTYDASASTAMKVKLQNIGKIGPGTAVAGTSGSAINFTDTNISGAQRLTVMGKAVSLSGTDNLLLEFRVASSYVVTGYTSTSVITLPSSSNSANSTSTAGIIVPIGSASATCDFIFDCFLLDPATNLWMVKVSGKYPSSGNVFHGHGEIALSGPIDGFRLVPTGSDTFDTTGSGTKVNYQVQK